MHQASAKSDFRALALYAREFLRGLREPSVVSVAISAIVMLALFGTCTLALSERTIARYGLHRYLASSSRDDYMRTAGEAFQLRLADAHRFSVVFIGASSLRESIHDTEMIREAVERSVELPTDVYLLSTPNQNHWEDLALASYLPEDFRGVVVLSVSENRLSRTDDELRDRLASPRLPINYRAVAAEARRVGCVAPEDEPGTFLQYPAIYAERIPYLIFRTALGPVNWESHSYLGLAPIDDARWKRESKRVRELRIDHFESSFEKNLRVIESFVLQVKRSPNCRVVLLEAPSNPRFTNEIVGNARRETFLRTMKETAAKCDVEWWTLNEQTHLTTEDFYDWSHLRDRKVVRRYSEELAARLAKLVSRREHSIAEAP